MAVAYIFAHFDDEYCALPLILRRAREGVEQRFFYVVDYARAKVAATRLAETRALLAWAGVDPGNAVHIGAGTGALDGTVFRHLEAAFAALSGAVDAASPVERLVVNAWEGGHLDHDMCALMAGELGGRSGVPVEQISLYQGKGLPGPLYHGCSPLPENGPVTQVNLTTREWNQWLNAVRFFPTQKAWLGLWPAMFWTFAKRGFGYQTLAPGRTAERPHAGSLLYERTSKVPYAEVAAAAEAFRQARA